MSEQNDHRSTVGIVNFEHMTPCSSVSTVDFEHVLMNMYFEHVLLVLIF